VCLYSLIPFYGGVPNIGETSSESHPIKVYMYPLPPKFNTELVGLYGKKNANLKDQPGIGIPLNISEFVFNTNQFALEQYFYHRLKQSSHLTNNSAEADLIYIPFFGNIAKLSGQYHIYETFWDYMKQKYNLTHTLNTLYKHFVVFGGVRKWGQPFLEHWLIGKMNAVVLERNEGRARNSTFIVAPYPAQVHFHQNRADIIDYSKKTLLVSSAWNSRYPLRWTLSGMCKARKDICEHVELYSNSDYYNHTMLYEMTARSVFCLSPHGDSDTRKAFWDALMVGCINVVFNNNTKMPFDDIINYRNLTVYIPAERVSDTFKILQNISKEEIANKQQYIDKNRIHFQYTIIKDTDVATTLPFDKKDAFNLLLDEIYRQSLTRAPKKIK
jgi:hypothetical protein